MFSRDSPGVPPDPADTTLGERSEGAEARPVPGLTGHPPQRYSAASSDFTAAANASMSASVVSNAHIQRTSRRAGSQS